MWGNFVNGDAALNTSQFTVNFHDWVAWTLTRTYVGQYEGRTDGE